MYMQICEHYLALVWLVDRPSRAHDRDAMFASWGRHVTLMAAFVEDTVLDEERATALMIITRLASH